MSSPIGGICKVCGKLARRPQWFRPVFESVDVAICSRHCGVIFGFEQGRKVEVSKRDAAAAAAEKRLRALVTAADGGAVEFRARTVGELLGLLFFSFPPRCRSAAGDIVEPHPRRTN